MGSGRKGGSEKHDGSVVKSQISRLFSGCTDNDSSFHSYLQFGVQVLKFELYDIFNGPIKVNTHHTRKRTSTLLNIHGCLALQLSIANSKL